MRFTLLNTMEIYGKNLVQFRSGEVAEFVFVEEEVTRRIYNYLLYFGVDATMEDYFAHNNDTNEFYVTKKLNIPYKQLISFSKKFGKNKDKEEYLHDKSEMTATLLGGPSASSKDWILQF